jgi:hypothetical protein
VTTSPFSARELVGLLADKDRRLVFAALVLGGGDLATVRGPRPNVRSKRLVVLDWISQRFEPGRRYSETMVNLVIAQVHPDTAAPRRYFVDDDFLSRANGEYWRTGGSYAPPPDV